MVSIKSLAVLLFAAAVTAAPLAGGNDHGHDADTATSIKTENVCGNGKTIHCCTGGNSPKGASFVDILNNLDAKCTDLGVNVLASE